VAIFKLLRYPVDTAAVYEDVIPGANKIYIQFDAYQSTSLAPLFDVGVNHSLTGLAPLGFGNDRPGGGTNGVGSSGVLQIGGEVTYVQTTTFNTLNVITNNMDQTPFISMDPTKPIVQQRYETDGTNKMVWSSYNKFGVANFTMYYHARLNLGQDLTKNFVQYSTDSFTALASNPSMGWPLFRNSATNNLIFAMAFNGSQFPGAYIGARLATTFSGAPTLSALTSTAGSTVQFVGQTADGRAIMLLNSLTTDHTQTYFRYNDSDNTSTTLTTLSAAPSASGTSAGGNRGTNFGTYLPKYASRTFTDPNTATIKGFYVPFLDVNGFYHPFYMQWDTTTDAFTRNTDITMVYPVGAQSSYWATDTLSASSVGVTSGYQRAWYNETFTFGGSRYLTLFQLHGAGGVFDNFPQMRTMMTYTMNPSQPKTLTFHSATTVPSTPKNIVWLDNSRTTCGIFGHNNFYIYTFNSTSGWTLTTNLPYQFYAAGRDSTGRIWAIETGPLGYGLLHLITPTVPVTLTVTSASASYNYSGSTISSTVAVNAYDYAGNRIVAAVKLVIEGSSMTFDGSAQTRFVTTSAGADTTVNISIIGPGVSGIVASANL
jgi:hypothetical protein